MEAEETKEVSRGIEATEQRATRMARSRRRESSWTVVRAAVMIALAVLDPRGRGGSEVNKKNTPPKAVDGKESMTKTLWILVVVVVTIVMLAEVAGLGVS